MSAVLASQQAIACPGTTCTTAMQFVDTNILLYAISPAPEESAKRDIALHILRGTDLCLSVQVLQEFFVQATRRSRIGRLTHDEAASLVSSWQRFPVLDLTMRIVEHAIATSQRFQVSYWDAAIIAAARAAGCTIILTEDLQHGQTFDGVRVMNPFLASRNF